MRKFISNIAAVKRQREFNQTVKSLRKNVNRLWKRKGSTWLKIVGLTVFSLAVFIGTQDPSSSLESPLARANATSEYESANVDEIAGIELAAEIARAGNLVISDNIQNLADSVSTQVQIAGTDTQPYVAKPSLISTDTKTNKDIITYTVVRGDTISSIAKRFSVTSDTIRWANNLFGEAVATGKKLKILPVSGLEHTVTRGETADSIADKYKANSTSIISFNDLEISGLKVGSKIIVPGGKKAALPNYFVSGLSFGQGNGYSYGYCTWHVANRRAQIGKPLPTGLGNAYTWYARASGGGLSVGSTPRAGAAGWDSRGPFAPGSGGYGHVVFVEKVNSDGSFWISEMNASGLVSMDVDSARTGGWNRIDFRLITPSSNTYKFIY